MSVPKMSAIWLATGSGIRASSVAANSELRIVPLPIRTCAASGAVSTLARSLPSTRLMRSRVKWVPN